MFARAVGFCNGHALGSLPGELAPIEAIFVEGCGCDATRVEGYPA